MITRLEFMRLLRKGRTLSKHFVGKEVYAGKVHTFDMDIRLLTPGRRFKGHRINYLIMAYLYDGMMMKTYKIELSAKDLLNYIRMHYPRHERSVESVAA